MTDDLIGRLTELEWVAEGGVADTVGQAIAALRASKEREERLRGALKGLLPTIQCMARHGVRFDPEQVAEAEAILKETSHAE